VDQVRLESQRFALESTLGEGASGVVYLARDRETGARVALKTLRTVTPGQIAQLKNEFRAIQGLNHPNLVRLGEIFEEAGSWYLSMEHVDGTDFQHYVSPSDGRFDEARLRSALRQLASALSALHAAQIVHRDLKPSNVLVTNDGRVVVLDFGIALREEAVHGRDEGVTGTALYMAPEQTVGEATGPAADWYAVGVMLFRALTGRHPFEGLPTEVMEKKLLGSAPSPTALATGLPEDLAVLAERLLATEAEDRAGYAEVSRCLHLSTRPPPHAHVNDVLFGRDRELEWLFDAYRASREGEPVVAVLYGESGVGKSLLLRTFLERIASEAPDAVALFSRCYERATVPFKALDGAAEALVGVLNRLGPDALESCLSEHAGLIPRLFPELGAVPALAERTRGAHNDDPKEARRRGFEALRAVFAGLAARGPLLLVIDDLQWADEDSIGLLRALLEPPAAPPVFLLCTLRVTTETSARGRDLVRRIAPLARSRSLEKLGRNDAEDFVAELVAHEKLAPPSPETLTALLAEAAGHPMFLSELVRQGWGDEPWGRRRLDDILRQRVKRLSAASRRMLEVVCVAGVPIDQRIAAEAAAVQEGELLGVVPELDATRLVQTSGAGRSALVEPYHSRVRDAVAAGLAQAQVEVWHGKLALALERSGCDKPEVLAAHWLGAGDKRRALEYVRSAAERAFESLAFDRAAQYFAQAIELSDDDALVRSLRVALADALTYAGRGADAARASLSAAETAPPDEALELQRRAAEQFLISGHLIEGRETLARVLAHFRLRLARTTLRAVLTLLVLRVWVLVRGLGLRVRDPATVSTRALQRIDVCWATSTGLSVVDNVRAAEFSARHLLLALRAGDPIRYHRALVVESCFQGAQGARVRARRMLDLVRPIAESGSSPYLTAFHALGVGWQAYFNGEFRVGREHCQRSRDLFEEGALGARWERDMGAYWALCSGVFLGELPGVTRRLPRYLRDAEDRGDLFFETLLRVGHTAVHWLAIDDTKALETALDDLLPRWPSDAFLIQHMYALWSRTLVDLYEGGGAASVALYEEGWRGMERGMHLRVKLSRARALQLRAAANLGAAENTKSPAEHLARAQADAHRILRLEAPWCAGWGELLLAGVAYRERRPELARERLVGAVAALERAELGLYAAAAEVRLGVLLGGDEGRAKRARGSAFLERQGVVAHEKMLRALAPGFGPLAP